MTGLIILFGLLQIADIASTTRALDRGARELNPVVRWFMARLGRAGGLVATKTIGAAVIIPAMLLAYAYAATVAIIAIILICAAYAYVVLHNWRQV